MGAIPFRMFRATNIVHVETHVIADDIFFGSDDVFFSCQNKCKDLVTLGKKVTKFSRTKFSRLLREVRIETLCALCVSELTPLLYCWQHSENE